MRRQRTHTHKGKTRLGFKYPRKLKKQMKMELKKRGRKTEFYINDLWKKYGSDAYKYWICGG